jgi:4-hydroxybenzoate polyprenyltransferase
MIGPNAGRSKRCVVDRVGDHRKRGRRCPPAKGTGSQEEICTMSMLLSNTLAALSEYFSWWQGVLLIILIVLIVFYWQYRKKQM